MNGELERLVKTAVAEKTKQFRKSLQSNNVSRECEAAIFSSLDSYEDNVSSTFTLFRTPFLIERYMEKNFNLVLPTRIKLGAGEFQYVPVGKVLKKIVEDPTFKKYQTSPHVNKIPDLLRDVSDGLHFQSHPFFLENPEALK
jgi:hypothetical protein